MIETIKQPYEFLVRWRNGAISGAHVGFELVTVENGKTLAVTPMDVMPVAIGGGVGFPLADILSQIHIDALIQRDEAQTMCQMKAEECAQHEATIEERDKTIAELTSALAEKDAHIAALNAQLTDGASPNETL